MKNNLPLELFVDFDARATNAIPLSEALKKAGGAVELELFPDVGHDVYGIGRPIEERLKAFFAAYL